MEKDPNRQLELFSDTQDDAKVYHRHSSQNHFSGRIWGYEKSILIVISLLVIGIISYSLGVKKGRRALGNTNEPVASLPKLEVTVPAMAVLPQELPLEPANKSGYAIQVASFKTDSYAKKEVEILKARGYKALTLDKGAHVIVCVGDFKNEAEAQSMLSALRRYYKDCRIRRL